MERKNKRIGMAFIGIILTAVSVGIFRYADFGVDPYCVLLTGLAKIFHTSFTMAANVTCALLLLFAWKMKKKPGGGIHTIKSAHIRRGGRCGICSAEKRV